MPSSTDCPLCSDNFIVNTKSIECSFCETSFHNHCVKVKDALCKYKQEHKNLYWFCDDCISVVKDKLKKNSSGVEEKTDLLLEKTTKLLNLVESKNIATNAGKWSDVVKKNLNNIEPLIIKSKDKNQSSSTTKSILEQKVDPSSINVAVEKVKQTAGCVVIHCQDKKSLEKLKNETESALGTDYEIKNW
nr:unnamed protein product [Callosobruchus analis]